LLPHLEGEEPPEASACAAVSDGEGSLIDARDRGYILFGEIRFKWWNSPAYIFPLKVLAVIVEATFRKDIGACCEAVPLAVAAYPTRSLLLPHLEGEEPPEAFTCAAVSDGEGSLIDARGRRYTLFGEIRFKWWNSPAYIFPLKDIRKAPFVSDGEGSLIDARKRIGFRLWP